MDYLVANVSYIIAGTVVVLILLSCIIILKPKEGVLISFFGGKIIREITTNGIYFKLPFPINICSSKVDLSVRPINKITTYIKKMNCLLQ